MRRLDPTRLMGIETEYALVGLDTDGATADRPRLLTELMDLAREHLRAVPDALSPGFFLENAGRLYPDLGEHPEFATPECSTPGEVVRYVLAGDRILWRLAEALVARRDDVAEVVLRRSNVCSASGTTWGTHESYQHRADPAALARNLIPHLVSRVVYSGAGGFDPHTAGADFLLSPRVAFLTHETSESATRTRPIFHTKNEELSRAGHARLHLVCGESLSSQLATWLTVGTTALLVAMVEAGLEPGAPVRLRKPLLTMRAFVRDPRCRRKAALLEGGRLSATAIQRHLLVQVENHLDDDFMPPWAETVCARWRWVLDLLERDAPDALVPLLDWPLRLALFQERTDVRGFTWAEVGAWSTVATRLAAGLRARAPARSDLTVGLVLGARSPIRDLVGRLTPELERTGLRWDRLEAFLTLREELVEIDGRFAQLGPHGLFARLDARGLLAHRVPEVGDVERATTTPPAIGRARLRGEWIRRLSGRGRAVRATWQSIYDLDAGRLLDLGDPFATAPTWKRPPNGDRSGLHECIGLQGAFGYLAEMIRGWRTRS